MPDTRTLRVHHETVYRYDRPVERSEHELRLQPVQDGLQRVRDFRLEVTPSGERRDFEDVLGNAVVYYRLQEPFTELRIVSESTVQVHAPPRIARPVGPRGPSMVPLMWLPAQYQLLQVYLMPPDLPQEQLRELFEFARSFAERREYDLLDVLTDMTTTIQRDFEYVPGVTSVETTAYDCLVHRRGVCQDFTNLLIVLARLLNVPARYRMGYIYTGTDYENRGQSEASHAWVECYIPWVGWRGFDPTNGCMTGVNHVRVAWGRNWHEAAPTAGTIYPGGVRETLEVSVRVEEVLPEPGDRLSRTAAAG